MHKLLARQLRRKAAIANDADLVQILSEVASLEAGSELRPEAARLLQALPGLFTEFENTYSQFDRDLELRRRSLEVSSSELLQVNGQLRAEAASRQRVLDSLREAANRLLHGAGLPVLRDDEANLESLSSLMAQLVRERETVQRKLAESEERLVLALNVTDSLAWDWDIVGSRLVVISTGDEVLGFPRESVEQNPARIAELMSRTDGARMREKLIEHLRGESAEFQFGAWMTIKERHRHYMQFHGKVVARGSDGRALRMAGILHDLTAIRKTEEALRVSEARFRSLTELSSDWYWEQDDQFRYTATHGETNARSGITADDYINRKRWELPHTEPVGFTWKDHRAMLERWEPFRDLMIKRAVPGAEPRYVSFSGMPIFSIRGKFMGYRGISKDVTARVQAEEALKQSQVAAEAATRAKSQFLANMSHEIRTPMNGVLGMTELLLGTPLNAKQRQFAETARRSGESLLTLINDILDFSKIEAGKLGIEHVDFALRELLEDVTQLLGESAASKGLELVCRVLPDVPVTVNGDPNRLRQIMINLIGNAIKFTERGEVVAEVRATTTHAGDRLLSFEVRDTGIGIAHEAQPNIFQAFSQADGSTTRHYGGTGLGLAICRQLVNLMGGDMMLESAPGKGSTFRFTVPYQGVMQDNDGEVLPPKASVLRGKRLLIVDDNRACREALQDIAEGRYGMYCSQAEDGIAALSLARQALQRNEAFDVAVIDVEMPKLGGVPLGEVLRRDAALGRMALILATPLHRAGEADRARAAGFSSAITKPVRQADLLRALLRSFGVDAGAVSQKLGMAAPLPATEPAPVRGNVLVAEDNPVNQEVIRAVLEDSGCVVTMANNGREVVEAVQRGRFDLIFMDCQMPVMDGYMATRAIRALEENGQGAHGGGRTPIVALTAHATHADRERCLSAGMDSYVSKPFTQAVLHRELQNWLAVGRSTFKEDAAAVPVTETLRLDVRALNELRQLDPTGKRNMLPGLMGTYLVHTHALIKRLRNAVEAGDLVNVAHEAHKLKSGSLTIGAARVGKLASALEHEGCSTSVEKCHALLAEIEIEFGYLEKLLKAEITPTLQ